MQVDIIGWLDRNKQWVFSGTGVAVLSAIIAIVRWLIRRRAATPQQAQQSGAGSQNIQAGRDIINVSLAAPTHAPSGTGPAVQPAPSEPTIVVREVRRTRVTFDAAKMRFVESVPEGNMAALVAFRNSSGVTAKDVTASIDFRSVVDSQTVLHGVWLNNSFSTQWIEPGRTEQLLIAAYCPDEHQYYTFDGQRHEIIEPAAEPLLRTLGKTIYDVTVTLSVAGTDHVYRFVLNLQEFQFDAASR